jgi:nanoRNase/pAp phosphatase (c-di-AMP/oligoRNAs hydrolase)
MGLYGDKEVVSLRTSRETGGAGEMIQEMMKDLGSNGGHGLMAGGQISPMESDPAVQGELQATLTKRLLAQLNIQASGQKLLPC